jgi:DHA1 family tetracycline resistance protein-like MFS transporter
LNWLYWWLILPESLAPENRRAFSWARSNPVGSLLDLRRYPIVFGLAGTFFLVQLAHQALPSTWVLYTSHRYHWSVGQIGLSLAIVGLTSAIVQAGLTRIIVGRIGEQRAVLMGLAIVTANFVGYGLAPQGWMIYLILGVGSLGGVAGPSIQGLISRSTGADEQGGVQGSLASLGSVAGIIGPPIATGLFGHFASESASVYLPGAAFYFSALLVFVALLLAVRCFRNARQANSAAATAPVAVSTQVK